MTHFVEKRIAIAVKGVNDRASEGARRVEAYHQSTIEYYHPAKQKCLDYIDNIKLKLSSLIRRVLRVVKLKQVSCGANFLESPYRSLELLRLP